MLHMKIAGLAVLYGRPPVTLTAQTEDMPDAHAGHLASPAQ